jgi:peptidoglycan/xylan/chitin deacetylase (PgdA/CDA1 family)
MQPLGGLTLLVNLAIILIERVNRKVSKFVKFKAPKTPKYMPHLIVTLSIFLGMFGLVQVIYMNSGGLYGFYLLYGSQYSCEPFGIDNQSDRLVLIRLDDVQAYAWRDTTERMVDDSMDKKVPLVLGVIPYNLNSDRLTLGMIKKNLCNIEVAQHGWSNDDFSHDTEKIESLERSQIYRNLIDGKKSLYSSTGEIPISFIPPTNYHNNQTREIIKESNFSIISSQGTSPYDYTAMTYDFQTNTTISNEVIISQCEEAFKQKRLCVIMTHPQEFSTDGNLDEAKYKKFTELLSSLQERNVSFVRFKDIIGRNFPAMSLTGDNTTASGY